MASRSHRSVLTSLCLVAGLAFSASAAATTHLVGKGDSLWSLARQYKTSVEAIKQANSLNKDTIRTGQKLSIPQSGKTSTKPAAAAKPARKQKAAAKKSAQQPEKANNARSQTGPSSKSDAAQKAKSDAAQKAKPNAPEAAPAKARVSEPKAPKPDTNEPVPGRVFAKVGKQALARAEKLYADPQRVLPNTLAERAPEWVLKPPAASTQVTKSNASRGGVFPCSAPDAGFGKYQKWVQVAPMAHLLAPTNLQLNKNGEFDILFHFHGREPLRKEWVQVMNGAVLVAVDVGIDSGAYADAFADARTFRQVVLAVEQELAQRADLKSATAQRIGLSAWSAGYGALEQILSQPFGKRVTDSVILLDGLHAGYSEESLEADRLRPFTEFAAKAARGEKFMFVSHSSIRTTGYASTTETAQYLVWKVGGKPQAIHGSVGDPWGLERISSFSEGQFHVRGFRGNGTSDHCAHIGLMHDVLRVHLKPRWDAPAPAEPRRMLKSPEAVAFGGTQRSDFRPTDAHSGDDLAKK